MRTVASKTVFFISIYLSLYSCSSEVEPDQKTKFPEDVGFHDIRVAILEQKCTRCHLEMASITGIQEYVVAGAPEKSDLYTIVKDGRMPPSGTKLSEGEKQAIYRWIENGAEL